MKTDRVKQVICISAGNAEDFQDQMNEALAHLSDPEIRLYDVPYTAVIIYAAKRNMPESILEMLEITEGKNYTCEACPHFGRETDDKRTRWGYCALDSKPIRQDARACERFYVYRYNLLSDIRDKYLDMPFTAE